MQFPPQRQRPLCLTIVAMSLFVVGCAYYPNGPLVGDEAYVVLNLKYEGDREISLRFSEFDERDKFTVGSRDPAPYLVRVKSGVYYLRNITTTTSDMSNPNLSALDSTSQAIQIPPGALVYIGDWHISSRSVRRFLWDLEVEFENDSLFAIAEEHTWARSLPLKVVMAGKPPIDVAWD